MVSWICAHSDTSKLIHKVVLQYYNMYVLTSRVFKLRYFQILVSMLMQSGEYSNTHWHKHTHTHTHTHMHGTHTHMCPHTHTHTHSLTDTHTWHMHTTMTITSLTHCALYTGIRCYVYGEWFNKAWKLICLRIIALGWGENFSSWCFGKNIWCIYKYIYI